MFKKKWVKVSCIIIGVILVIWLAIMLANYLCNVSLRKYINSFEPISYPEDRIVPLVDEDGRYYVTADRDIKVMHITDIHIGGGFWTYKNDKKSIYEVITMLQAEKPDFVVCGGDNTYCLIPLGFNGGGTFNNRMVAKTFISIFDHEQVYFTTVFGNHDTESMDTANRQEIGDLYMSGIAKYCFFKQEFCDENSDTVPSVSNQFIKVKNSDGDVVRLIMLIDSNAYEDTRFWSAVTAKYDVIHDEQIEWAKETITTLSKEEGLPEGEYIDTLTFMHIPIGEYRTALDDLIEEVFDEKGNIIGFNKKSNPVDTKYIEGFWEEKVCYGGLNKDAKPEDNDNFFEVLCDEMSAVDAIVCGHDHVNNAVVDYKGVQLIYGYSVDNEAYGDAIMKAGLQRGATVITISPDGSISQKHKNAYIDYGVSTDKFTNVYLDHHMYDDMYRDAK